MKTVNVSTLVNNDNTFNVTMLENTDIERHIT